MCAKPAGYHSNPQTLRETTQNPSYTQAKMTSVTRALFELHLQCFLSLKTKLQCCSYRCALFRPAITAFCWTNTTTFKAFRFSPVLIGAFRVHIFLPAGQLHSAPPVALHCSELLKGHIRNLRSEGFLQSPACLSAHFPKTSQQLKLTTQATPCSIKVAVPSKVAETPEKLLTLL